MAHIKKFEVTFSFPEYGGITMYDFMVERKLSELLHRPKCSVSVKEIK